MVKSLVGCSLNRSILYVEAASCNNINMAPKGEQTLANLNKKNIAHIGNVIYNIDPPLVVAQHIHKDDLLKQVREAMSLVQNCPSCGGNVCDPDSHKFQEDQYTPPADPTNFTAAMASLLSQTGYSPAFTSNGQNFLEGESVNFEELPDTEETRNAIILAATRQVSQQNVNGGNLTSSGSQSVTTTSQQVPATAVGNPAASSGAGLEKILADFVSMQKSQHEVMLQMLKNQGPAVADPAVPTAGKVVVATLPNPENAAYVGMSLPTMYTVKGDPKNLDMSKVKNKIKTGEIHSGTHEAIHYEPWPSHCINKMLCPNPPPNAKLNPIQYFSGSLNKILATVDPSQRGSVTENQLKFLASIANHSLIHRWEDILELSAGLYRLLEQKQITWDDPAALQTWWDRALDNMKSKTAANNSQQHGGNQPGGGMRYGDKVVDKNKQGLVAGLPVVWMQQNSFCIKFQTGSCTESGPHTTPKGNKMLKHACAGCSKIGKPDDTSHGAKECPNKTQFFQ